MELRVKSQESRVKSQKLLVSLIFLISLISLISLTLTPGAGGASSAPVTNPQSQL
ncbi:hypothetical protein FDUTEX481_05337 [Tolypothrix sp. PCC 7601]|nr:hypothetical protein FDUTEX481_05337 [Tolypothrix sp. PCC 7601]